VYAYLYQIYAMHETIVPDNYIVHY